MLGICRFALLHVEYWLDVEFFGTCGVFQKLFMVSRTMCVKVPCVVLLGSVVWYPNEFLLTRLPHMASALDRKALANVKSSRVAYLQQTTQGLVA